MVDEWVTATAAITGALEGATPESVNPSVVDEEEGLPSPPMDDLAFFATHNTSMELSQFFEGLDDDLNPRNCEDYKQKTESGRKPHMKLPSESVAPPRFRKEEVTMKEEALMKKQASIAKPKNHSMVESGIEKHAKPSSENKMKKQASIAKPKNHSMVESGIEKHAKPSSENKHRSETKLQKKSELASLRPPISQQNKTSSSDEAAVQQKLEATKRRLQESYQQAQEAKKQRTIQVMELRDLPKQSPPARNPHVKPANHNGSHNNRQLTNGRRRFL